MKKTSIFQKMSFKRTILTILCISLLSFFILISNQSVLAQDPSEGTNYFTSDFETREEVIDASNELNEDIYGEGVTMLKNIDNALPLPEGSKISLFGKNALTPLQSGSGSSSGVGNKGVTMEQALQNAGFQINPTLVNFYRDNNASGSGRGPAPSNTNIPSGYNTGETPVSMYTATIESSYSQYSDAAIVLFSRIAGEGFDLPRTMSWNGSDYRTWSDAHLVPGARSKTDHYLQLDKNESDLLKYLGGKFNKVIVLLNTGSQFEAGFLDDPTHYGYHENIKAGLWIGYPGGTGLTALAKILKGEINPSGKTTDTYARDFKKDPSWMNFANNLTNYGNQYSNLTNHSDVRGGYRNNYVYYEEGIYVGYRYYETRGYTDGEAWYNNNVVYPFGHGLSYTTFSQEIIEETPAKNTIISKDDVIKLKVKVTNTGTVAGKEVVQLYYTAPYINNGIEKSHVVLGAFEKTKLLAPNESEIIELTLKVQDMASYDYNDKNNNAFKGYELDAGTYEIKIMKNAHEVIESVSYQIDTTIKYEKDGDTGYTVENRFDDVSSKIHQEFSRSDWVGTFPTMQLKIAASQDIIDKVQLWFNGNNPNDNGQPYYSDTMPTIGNDTGEIKLADLYQLDYDDPLWDQYLNQLSINTMSNLAGNGSYRSGVDLPALGIKTVVNADSPAGWVNWSYGTGGSTYTLYSSETILAATWNKDIAYQKGRMIGNEGLFGNGGSESRFPGWYAPAVNIHRSQFGGRNFEYYSEDGYLSGILAAYVVKGAQDKGVFAYVKHFGVNEQETYRVGLMTWATEQSIREIYIKPFEVIVKVGKTRAIMSALNRIGAIWVGGSYELLTEILRNEWGFRGMVVTDSFMGGFSNFDQMIRTGGDLALGTGRVNYNPNTPTTVTALRNAAHNILYTHANSMAINTGWSAMPPALTDYNGELLEVGIVNAAYNVNIGTVKLNRAIYGEDADDSLIQYRLKEGSALPDGLVLGLDGVISGKPTEEVNNYKFTVVASYETYEREATFTISIINPNGSIIYEQQDDIPLIYVGGSIEYSLANAYIFKPDATQTEIDNFPPIEYSLQNGSYLPLGLKLSSDGTLSGIARKQIKNYKFTVVASALGYKERTSEFTINIYNKIQFEDKVLKKGQFGKYYIDQISLATSANDVKYELKAGSNLPQGLSFTTNSGYIVGVPTQVVTNHKFTIIAHSDFAESVEVEYLITIGITFNEVSIPYGKVNDEYETMINLAQGTRNIEYSLKDGGKMPEGLVLSSDGLITGIPEKAGTYVLNVEAKAEGYEGDDIFITLFIAPSDPKIDATKTVLLIVGLSVVVLGGAGGAVLLFIKKKK